MPYGIPRRVDSQQRPDGGTPQRGAFPPGAGKRHAIGEDAEREGVRSNGRRTITAVDGPELQVEQMELDETGFPQPTWRF